MTDDLTDELETELLSAARTAIGDELSSVTYFTANDVEQLYVREDIDEPGDLVGFAENERLGFHSQAVYDESALGHYQFTIRVFDHGYLARVIVEDHGVFVTTDEMDIDRFEEMGAALAGVLREF